MNNTRSYLDQMNAGRRRRPTSSIEQLSQTLDELEGRIRRPSDNRYEADDRPVARSAHRLSGDTAYGERDYGRERDPGRDRDYGRDRRAAPRDARSDPYRAMARDVEHARTRADGLAAVGSLASELNELREELRQQMGSGLHRQFSALKGEIESTVKAAVPATRANELGAEFDRLAGMIHQMADRGDDRQFDLLRLEMDEVKSALGKLAREETLQSFDRRWGELASQAGRAGAADSEAMQGLVARLEQIGDAINGLPNSVTLRSLEDKMKVLASAVDKFAHQRDAIGPEALDAIEMRLDEISRAVAASAVAAQPATFDPQPFERIEARISSLARQLGEIVEDNPSAALIDQLSHLSRRVDEIAHRVDMPDLAVERLAEQMGLVARRLDSGPVTPDLGPALDGLEDRVASLANLLEQRHEDSLVQGRALFRDLEKRLDDVSDRIRAADAAPAAGAGLIEALDARFDQLTARMESQPEPRLDESALRDLEARLDSISSRIDRAPAPASVDPDLIRSLEAQVAGLAAHINRPAGPMPEFEAIAPRLDKIEHSIGQGRQDVMKAAREAAEETARKFASNSGEGPLVSGFVEDLKALEALVRKADDRNTKTFSAIHDTLLKIVDRLGTVEAGVAAPREPAAPRKAAAPEPAPRETALAPEQTPPLQPALETMPMPAAPEIVDAPARTQPAQVRRSAAAAAAEAAADALREGEEATVPEATRGRLSMLGGLTRAFSGRKGKQDAPAAEAVVETKAARVEPAIDVEAPLDPKVANQPLEPGSGAPDLNAIMKRVRDERGQPSRGSEADAAKSDFIAAARRAAQAAAAEAEMMKRGGPVAKGDAKGFGIGGLFKGRSKPVLMGVAAILIALAALQIGKSFTLGGDEIAEAPTPAPIVAEVMQDADTLVTDSVSDEIVIEDQAEAALEPDAPDVRMAEPSQPDGSARALMAEAPASAEAVTTDWLDGAATISPAPAATEELPEAIPEPSDADIAAIPLEAGPVALREAAAAGDPKALFEIGNRYADGRGVTEDMAVAATWYEKAAEQGLAAAQYRIGNMLEKGIGRPRDIDQAKTWYQLSAGQGNASAMHNLAVLFAMGADGTTDNDSAVRWFLSAAELGVKDSQFNLGILSAKGVGMEQNLEEAYKWFALVAKTGDKDAIEKRDEIANALRPEQLEKARAASELWRAKPLNPEANSVEIPDSWNETQDTTASVDMKQAVRNIQQILNANGYDAGSEDGVMGRKTKTAIARFQAAKGMAPTGEIDEPLVRALLDTQ